MSPCRALLTLYALGLAITALAVLAVANEMLRRLDDAQAAAREGLENSLEPPAPAIPAFYRREVVSATHG